MTTEDTKITEDEVASVADLTAEHHGWLIKVAEPGPVGHRTFLLGKGFKVGVRKWTRDDGTEWVGLCDEGGKSVGCVGTERIYPAVTACELVRQVKKPRKNRASA